MSSLPFKSLLLPAVFVSGTVFSALLITFIAHQPRPEAIDELASDTRETEYVALKERREFTIRYVGLSVMVSVGVGIMTVEGLRKWRSFWESPQDKARQFGLEQILQEDFEHAPLELELAIHEASIRSNSAAQSLQVTHALSPDAFVEMETDTDDRTDQFSFWDFSLQDLTNSVTPPEQSLLNGTENVLENATENDADRSEAPQSTVQEQLALLDLPQPTETCRIKVPYSQQIRFASLFEDKYYCFVKVEKTKDQALKTATLLVGRGDRPLITPIKQGFAVWVWEPEAIVELST